MMMMMIYSSIPEKKGKICDERCTLELERPMECVISLQFLTRFFFALINKDL